MAFNVNEFRAQLSSDGARPNLFQVEIPFIPNLVTNASRASQKITFQARSASLPGSTLGVVSTQYFGREVKLAGNRQIPEWTTTVMNDEDFTVRRAVEQWMNGINAHEANLRNPSARSSLGYTTDATVLQYGKTGSVIKEYTMVGCWPSDLSPIDLGWDSNDSIEEYTITWQVQYWTSDITT